MKNTIYVLAVILLFNVTACNEDEFLTRLPHGAPSEGTFWRTEGDAIAAMNAVYQKMNSFYLRDVVWFNNASDNTVTGRTKSEPDKIKRFQCDGSEGYTGKIWARRYALIKSANDVITNLPKMNISEALKKRLVAEARFLAALAYQEMANLYGDHRAGIPIIKRDVKDPFENAYLPREKNVGINYTYIADEIKAAITGLPYFDEMKPEEYGRAHKSAAQAYLARTYIYHAKYDSKYWKDAEDICTEIIESGKHDLENEYEDAFKVKNNVGSEYIWSCPSSAQYGSHIIGAMWENKGWGQYNGWGYYQPTKELFDSFENGDKRRDWTLLKEGDTFTYFGDDNFKWTQTKNNLTGFMFGKYRDPFAPKDAIGTTVNPNGNDPTVALWYPLLRYAEVLLFRAEARLMQKKDADNDINKIRVRAGLAEIDGATIDDLKRERRSELAGEWPSRHFDLVRWGDADEVYNRPLHARDDSEIWEARPQFDPDIHHVWPIPRREIDKSKGTLIQNKGW